MSVPMSAPKLAVMPLALLALVGTLRPAPTATPPDRYPIEAFMATVDYRGASFSPDGSKILVSHNGSGIFNAYAVAVDGSGAKALTGSDRDAVSVVSYFGQDERFLFTADEGGNELAHLFVRELDGSFTDLTPGEGLRAQFAGWGEGRHTFFVLTNERDPRYFDLYRYRIGAGYPRELLYVNRDGYQVGPVSPDGRRLALTRVRTRADNDVYVLDPASGNRVHVTPHEGDASSAPWAFSPDGGSLYFTTDIGREFQALFRFDLALRDAEIIAAPRWDVARAGLSESGRYLVAEVNADARTQLRIYDTETLGEVDLPPAPVGDVTGVTFDADESRIAFYAGDDRNPPDLYVVSLYETKPVRLTRSLNPDIDVQDLVEGRVVRFSSYDGLEIPGILYRPQGASAQQRVPALVWVHGGPGGQSRHGYRAVIQYLVNHGYAVFAINNRGSSGYGKSFFAADDRRHGEADLGDVVASKRMLVETGWVDPERVGIIGGSYGGYMVLAAQAFQPGEFEVGVDLFGVANWLRTLESIPPWWEAERDALYTELGDPATDEERLRRISPLFHAENIRAPLLVLQGANDPRVLQVESDEIVQAVRSNGVPVEYLVFPDEGHGFRKRANEIEGYRAVLDFLNEHLGGQSSAGTS